MSSNHNSVIREGALWGSAAAVVLAAHLGGALWILHRAEAAAPPGMPDAVYVELADIAQAAAPPDEVESEQVAEAEPEPEPEPAPDFAMAEPLPELEPLPDMNSLFPPPPDAVVLQKSVRPKTRPEPPDPEPKVATQEQVPKKEEKKEKAPQQQAQRQASTTVRAPKAQQTTSQQSGAQPSARQVATWESKVNSAVARHMRRARVSQKGASVTVAFTISPNGAVSGGRLMNSTGDARTDAALQRQAGSLPRMPPHPSGRSIPISLPVRIN
ncbi:MAG TPA: TonB family protein [Paracoccus sp. (in: a-proteobacteria)]|uniref:TonB family protein n=1 Tax=Paracoccus sp. TaxID=267 RepID=UPI002B8EF064|nr:TonB family protein [Paracoccus sp. (in: a-proteobacteria)]HWL55181.1 TonB family protein [Paracoccus sp. (in: a-proteobacteria)]